MSYNNLVKSLSKQLLNKGDCKPQVLFKEITAMPEIPQRVLPDVMTFVGLTNHGGENFILARNIMLKLMGQNPQFTNNQFYHVYMAMSKLLIKEPSYTKRAQELIEQQNLDALQFVSLLSSLQSMRVSLPTQVIRQRFRQILKMLDFQVGVNLLYVLSGEKDRFLTEIEQLFSKLQSCEFQNYTYSNSIKLIQSCYDFDEKSIALQFETQNKMIAPILHTSYQAINLQPMVYAHKASFGGVIEVIPKPEERYKKSKFEYYVSQILDKIGITYEKGVQIGRIYEADLFVRQTTLIDIHGPTHYILDTETDEKILTTNHDRRAQHLKSAGYPDLITIPYFVWENLDNSQQTEYIKKVLKL